MPMIALPNELRPPARIYTCWPSDAELWPRVLDEARAEFAGFVAALDVPVTVLAANSETAASARGALGPSVEILEAPYGDVWTRDTGPVFLHQDGRLTAVRFGFNGWGGKYEYPGDETVGAVIARHAGAVVRDVDLIVEGGALEFDGEGTLLTTRQCLLNPNRNPGRSEVEVEAALKSALGVETILWIDDGLRFDHTDGHIDNIVRFAGPGHVVCQSPAGEDDPQAGMLAAIRSQLETFTDAKGRKLRVTEIPSPGLVRDAAGEVMPASHLNWVIGDKAIIVPVYGTALEDEALAKLRSVFPDHDVAARASNAILTGGGAFHCVTCHVPDAGYEAQA